MRGKCTLCLALFAVIFLVSGAVLLGCSWVIQDFIKSFIHDSIRDQIIIDSLDSPGFKSWSNNFDDHALLYYEFYMYNVTNVDELLNGGSFINVSLIGPYMYWCKTLRFDVEFRNDGTEVRYLNWKRWNFLPEQSCAGCKETDVFVNINYAYIGALSQTGGELLLDIALTGPITKTDIFGFFWGPFTQDVASQKRASIVPQAKAAIIANTTGPNPELSFYSNWANATSQSSPLWKGMLVSSLSGVPSNISLGSARALFNQAIPFSLLDNTLGVAKLWRRAFNNETDSFQQLSAAFNLSTSQLWTVLNWLNSSCNPELVFPALVQEYQMNNISDLAFVQWGQGKVTNLVSVRTLYPEYNFPMTYELALFYPLDIINIDLPTARLCLEGPYGLFDAPNLRLYQQALAAFNFTLIKERWGLNLESVVTTGTYFGFVNVELAIPFLNNLRASGNGLFTNRTLHQWLWDMKDPLIELLSPKEAQVGLVVNQTSMDFVRQTKRPNLCRTGKYDWNQIGDYIEFEGNSVIDGVYASPLPVTGKNDVGEFIPGMNESVILHNFDDEYIRDMKLMPTEKIEVKGIPAIRYELSNDTWSPNPFYLQTIQGFANLTGYHNGSTVFMSNPHMYMCDPKYVQKVSPVGLNSTLDVVRIDVEPHTGAVIQYREGLQVNIYLDPANADWFSIETKLKSDIFYPIMMVSEFSTLRDKDASLLKTLYLGLKIEGMILYICIGISVGMIAVLGLPISAIVIWRVKRSSQESPVRRGDGYFPLPNAAGGSDGVSSAPIVTSINPSISSPSSLED